jgi:hypothetical protein
MISPKLHEPLAITIHVERLLLARSAQVDVSYSRVRYTGDQA